MALLITPHPRAFRQQATEPVPRRGCGVRGPVAESSFARSKLRFVATPSLPARRSRRFCRLLRGWPWLHRLGRSSLSYSNRHADLLFEVMSRRYEHRPTIVATNEPFAEWNEVFPNAACVVTLVDRLVHKSEVVSIKAESYRLKEAKERAERRAKAKKA